MNAKPSQPHEAIRLLFELDLADNPRLYEDLIRFKKGTKRINRLRFLAHEGLVAQSTIVSIQGSTMQTPAQSAPALARGAAGASFDSTVAAGVFDEPISG